MVSIFVDIYVDLFLLYLLYRFVKPQRILKNGQAEASILLFAHDAKRASNRLLESYKEEHEQKKAKMLKKKHEDFLAFVIRDMFSDFQTES